MRYVVSKEYPGIIIDQGGKGVGIKFLDTQDVCDKLNHMDYCLTEIVLENYDNCAKIKLYEIFLKHIKKELKENRLKDVKNETFID